MKWWGLVATIVVLVGVCCHQTIQDPVVDKGVGVDLNTTETIRNKTETELALEKVTADRDALNQQIEILTLALTTNQSTADGSTPKSSVNEIETTGGNVTTPSSTSGNGTNTTTPELKQEIRQCYEWRRNCSGFENTCLNVTTDKMKNCTQGFDNCVNVQADKLKNCTLGLDICATIRHSEGTVDRFCTNNTFATETGVDWKNGPGVASYSYCYSNGCNGNWTNDTNLAPFSLPANGTNGTLFGNFSPPVDKLANDTKLPHFRNGSSFPVNAAEGQSEASSFTVLGVVVLSVVMICFG